jgi:hypothetical protein
MMDEVQKPSNSEDVPSLNLGSVTGYSESCFSWFPEVIKGEWNL